MLTIEFVNFRSKREKTEEISLLINEAKKYLISPSSVNNIYDIILSCSGLIDDYYGKILLNEQDIQKCKYSKAYLQYHSLFIVDNKCYIPCLTVRQNIKIMSYYWNKRDISDSVIAGFDLYDIADIKVSKLNSEQKAIVSLSRILSCPSHFWLISKKAMYFDGQEFSAQNQRIIDNIIDIRTKQNGAILII